MQNVANKVVIITGASSGLGAETARHLVQAGAKVILGARRLDRLHVLADELGISHDHCVQTDVTKLGEVQALAQRALDLYSRIDVLLNNAGVMPLSLLEELKVDEWNQMIDINIKGVLHGIAAVLLTMKTQKSGQIINVSSVAGHVWGPLLLFILRPKPRYAPFLKACARKLNLTTCVLLFSARVQLKAN